MGGAPKAYSANKQIFKNTRQNRVKKKNKVKRDLFIAS